MDEQDWNYVITIWNEEGGPSYYFTNDNEEVKEFMGKIEYMNIMKAKVDCYFGIYLNNKTKLS